ncbi:arginyl-tRNA--protein transferase 1 isoform X3 [Corythoichthys intestinalis]|uniref:arginyl-tRNA--protein transferase 1 isoform X3 n=1 Tax=Corythoichthys intestinalis TaxID=161448 RepID=UPI0025A576D5|nr:arginyl-tRNA--protein transferase 1 isoform X3 [Corythoichthys intestinalis]
MSILGTELYFVTQPNVFILIAWAVKWEWTADWNAAEVPPLLRKCMTLVHDTTQVFTYLPSVVGLIMAGNNSYTIVEYFGGDDGYRCGYCKNEKGNFSHGMWSHTMTVQDYQDLIDRGWRRSGKYVYKPIMNKTCCPQYTIRCHAVKFQPSKSHKKILKKVNKFISNGVLPKEREPEEPMDSVCEAAVPREPIKGMECAVTDIQKEEVESLVLTNVEQNKAEAKSREPEPPRKEPAIVTDSRTTVTAPKPGVGIDSNRPPCRKAKDLRKERRHQKEQMKKSSVGGSSTLTTKPTTPSQTNTTKTLEDFLTETCPDSSSHCLEFRRFLCDSPLEAEYSVDGPEMGYGSFHQQYWLDGQIVAVGVIDILPTCVSSVYLYYHPDFAFLSLGSYSALREIAFTRQLQKQSPKLSHYYLGFYIHSCPKMRYKGQYRPSDLLCPETFVWVTIEQCLPLLENSRYARFNPNCDEGDARVLKDVGRALVLHRRTVMPYTVYSRKQKGSGDETEVKEYASLVGQNCAERILLYRA